MLSYMECISKAQEGRDLARRSDNPAHQTILEHIAETWDRVARDVANEGNGGTGDKRLN